ncbi:MAG TPA: glycerate kinase [Tepidisphaeraceae bacterium]|jgi:glycerate kinase
MRVLIAPDKFKSCMTANQVAAQIAAAVREVHPDAEVDLCPLADGGEGTVQALVSAAGGSFCKQRVTGPLTDMKVEATWGMIPGAAGRVAVIEMSAASGLHLLREEERNPELTTTFGTGELLLAVARQGARKIILGIGGSATIDGGIGCCQAAAMPVILDEVGPADSNEPLVGMDLPRVVLIKNGRGSALDGVAIEVASDVSNPLYGEEGAAKVFGPQKGATPEQVEQFDRWLRQLAMRCGADEVAQRAGAGAAGGLGFAMMAFFSATLRPGFNIVAEAVGLESRVLRADLVITGEGRLDASSRHGKVPAAVGEMCRGLGRKCVAIVGEAEAGVDWREYFASVNALTALEPDRAAAMSRAPELLQQVTRRVLAEGGASADV